jgi:hypothetical protein
MSGRLLCAALAALLVGCGSSGGHKADKDRVASIKSVAVVAFSVPRVVAEEAGSGPLGGLTALVSLGKEAVGKGSGAVRGNGDKVAADAVAGFVDELAKQTDMRFMAMDSVVGNAEFKAMVQANDQSTGKGINHAAVPGLPVVVLSRSAERSDFAARAAKALGVDGVVMVDINELNYFLYTGTVGTGQAKAKGSALFKLFDREGQPVWESAAVVFSDASAVMVAGAVDPTSAPRLHRDIGATLVKDLMKTYRK